MEHSQQAPSQKIKRAPVHEGPKNHLISFALSVVLTTLSFITVMNPNLSSTFKYSFIVILACIQVLIQLAFWMHMKDRGHFFPRVFILGGCIFVFTFVIMAQFWVWW